jgi:hypothetical protein
LQITINDVRFALHHVLESAFPEISISSVEPNPTIDVPYFVVHLLEFTQVQEYAGRYRRSFPFVIRYMADQESVDAKYERAEQVVAAIGQIVVGGYKLAGQNLSMEMIDEQLHFFVTYGMLVRAQQLESSKMQHIEGGIAVE